METINDFFLGAQFITVLTIIAAILYFAVFERKAPKK